jgi:hypothetical protein
MGTTQQIVDYGGTAFENGGTLTMYSQIGKIDLTFCEVFKARIC